MEEGGDGVVTVGVVEDDDGGGEGNTVDVGEDDGRRSTR